MAKKKILAAMSGGVDSSVAAAVCQRNGYEVVGVTLRLKHPDPAFAKFQTCVSENDEETITELIKKLGIEHHFLDLYPDFAKLVLEPAWREYCRGRTPNPCTYCNFFIKFGKLLEFAQEIGAEEIVTGHYAQIINENGIYKLKRGSDPLKDQSYFLYRLTQEQLAQIRFPVGEMRKSEVRALARELGLKNSGKKDSQDACFAVDGEVFPETLRRLFDGSPKGGDFIYQGKIVGRHAGLHKYTIGQRKGLRVALGKPGYIQAIDPESGRINLVTGNEELMSDSFAAGNINWQGGSPPELPFHCLVQVRYRSKPTAGNVKTADNGGLKITLDSPGRAVTPGQAVVFYDGDYLLGGGIIEQVNGQVSNSD
ncbi:MAG: tRNA 2-thiouridine(34) synthase MnmA [Victivallaceae bacterium]|nr:tRNA 2-thiouridine(34) synthase MnmA [Victivallaceae bacterium]